MPSEKSVALNVINCADGRVNFPSCVLGRAGGGAESGEEQFDRDQNKPQGPLV
jgi:hypothetical protein